MAYFNHAFFKSFLAADASAADGTKTSALTAGQLALVDGSDWTAHAAGGAAFPVPGLAYLVQGSLHANDTIGGNKHHGGYAESVKSKGINPKFLGLEGFLLLSNVNQLSPLSILLIIKNAGSNPVTTIGPLVEPLPV